MSDQKPNSWPKFIWGLFALSMLLSCAVLVCLGWFGLTGSGFPSDFPIWFPGAAACLTLICTIVNISSGNPSAYEILLPDSIQAGIWLGVVVEMALFIADTNSLGSCAQVSSALKSSCIVSQLVLWAGVGLVHASFAKLAVAFYVRRQAIQRSSQQQQQQQPDCEKAPPTPPL